MRGSILPSLALFLVALLLYLLPPEWPAAWRLAIRSYALDLRDAAHSRRASDAARLYPRDAPDGGPDFVLATDRRGLEDRLRQCEAEIASLRVRVALREEARTVHPTLRFLAANVLALGGGLVGDELTIDRGRADGLEVGDVVLQGQAVVGTVAQVGARASRVLLLSAPGHVLPARTGTAPREICAVHGKGGGRAIVLFYGPHARAERGADLFTSDLAAPIPPDLPIGTLSADPAPGETPNTLEAPLTLRAEWTALDEVLVVRRIAVDAADAASGSE